eukprot:37019-Eustigmatos_ZCMA.PRE.1
MHRRSFCRAGRAADAAGNAIFRRARLERRGRHLLRRGAPVQAPAIVIGPHTGDRQRRVAADLKHRIVLRCIFILLP